MLFLNLQIFLSRGIIIINFLPFETYENTVRYLELIGVKRLSSVDNFIFLGCYTAFNSRVTKLL